MIIPYILSYLLGVVFEGFIGLDHLVAGEAIIEIGIT